MHQQPRAPPRASSPASSPQTNPTRTNNPRDPAPTPRPRTASELSNPSRRNSAALTTPAEHPSAGPNSESIKKLDQIIQNFHTKAAALILESRVKLKYSQTAAGNRKLNKWFQIETDDFDDFRDELRTWRLGSAFDSLPPPLIIETYLDTSRLTSSQSLVIVDEDGKRWDVLEALNSTDSSGASSYHSTARGRSADVVLERWRIDLKPLPGNESDTMADFGPILPTIYKKAIVFFRSLYLTTHVLPMWNSIQRNKTKPSHPVLEPRCRIYAGDRALPSPDRLRQPLFDSPGEVVTDYVFGDLEVPVGRFYASVSYRNDCNFRVDDSEALLSSRFMGIDENFFKPSLPADRRRPIESFADLGSLPSSHRHGRQPDHAQQTYGSLSTFHGDGALGTSPLSALKAVPVPGSDTSSPAASPRIADVEPAPPHSMPIGGFGTAAPKPFVLSNDGPSRRPSVSFQHRHPFKAGSLSGSSVPRTHDSESPASPHSATSRTAALPALTQPRNRSSLTAGMPASLRGIPPPSVAATSVETAALASSPRPASTSRYSSSFTHRRGRLSFSGANNKAPDDEQGSSSGRQSLASSVAQPGSGLLADPSAASPGGSLHTDDDNISEFLKILESGKQLRSFEPKGKYSEGATSRTVAQLSRFQMMRDSNNALTESMSSSLHLNRSSSTSSRQLGGGGPVSSAAAIASASLSSSPGKPLSPHTPHTPAVPSRLSETYHPPSSTRHPNPGERTISGLQRDETITQEKIGGVSAIDIPLSPRLRAHHIRRSSSAAQKPLSMTVAAEVDDGDPAFAHRSISLGAEDRDPPTRSMLRRNPAPTSGGVHTESPGQRSSLAEVTTASSLTSAAMAVPGAGSAASSSSLRQQGSADGKVPPSGLLPAEASTSPYGRRRYTGMGTSAGRGQTPPQSSRGSLAASGGRYSRGEHDVDDEPLVFDMSEMDAQSRRSLEDTRGSAGAGGGSSMPSRDRGGYESRGAARRGW